MVTNHEGFVCSFYFAFGPIPGVKVYIVLSVCIIY